mmetsp:Transcript_163725/g.525107  ORF Transcript_163725/g.525107 Transcript_163725/m.525107 type:complete len:517 (+) Transcript_163725:31-1581(+)
MSDRNSYELLNKNANSSANVNQGAVHRSSPRESSRFAIPTRASLSFVEHDAFQSFMGVVILGNLAVLAGETDHPEWAIWGYCDDGVLGLFLIEVAIKLLYRGVPKFLTSHDRVWNVLDLIIVALGVLESWLGVICRRATTHLSRRSGSGWSFYSLVRILRLTRLLRLLKLFKVVKQFMALLNAFRAMMESFGVVLGVLVLWILACAIVCTQMLGHGSGTDQNSERMKELQPLFQTHFRDIPTTMFSLFQVTTLDNWINIAQPAIELDSRWQGFFVVFICIASWTMISILTAVASENVVESAMGREEGQKKAAAEAQKQFLSFLRDAFVQADADGNGLLDKEEFEGLINQEDVIAKMRASSSLSPDDLMQAWDTLDVNRVGELTIDEFVAGFAMMNEGLSTKHIASFDYALQRSAFDFLKRVTRLSEGMMSVRTQNEELLEHLRRDAKREQKLAQQMWAWRTQALEKARFGQAPDPDLVEMLENLEAPRMATWDNPSEQWRSRGSVRATQFARTEFS